MRGERKNRILTAPFGGGLEAPWGRRGEKELSSEVAVGERGELLQLWGNSLRQGTHPIFFARAASYTRAMAAASVPVNLPALVVSQERISQVKTAQRADG